MQAWHSPCNLIITLHIIQFTIKASRSSSANLCITFNQSIIDIWNAAVPNDTIDFFVVKMYVKYPGIYEHLEGDIICQPGKNEHLYTHHHHTRLVPCGSENQFAVLDILPQHLWNELMNAWWRQIWKRKNPWYDAWKDAEFQIFCLRAHYESRFPIAPYPITDRHRAIGPGVQEVQEGGDHGVPPVPEQRASISPAPGLAPAH